MYQSGVSRVQLIIQKRKLWPIYYHLTNRPNKILELFKEKQMYMLYQRKIVSQEPLPDYGHVSTQVGMKLYMTGGSDFNQDDASH